MSPAVWAIVINWNGGWVVEECLASLDRAAEPQMNLLVVDNGSGDGSLERLRNRFPALEVIANERNVGFAEASNIGMRHAFARGAEFILLLNHDVVLGADAAKALLSPMLEDDGIGVCGGKILRLDDERVLYCVWEEIRFNHVVTRSVGEGEPDRGQYDRRRNVDCVCGCAMLIRRKLAEEIGVFAPDFFAYHEQVDFCERARRRGWSIAYEPGARFYHYGEFSLRTRGQLPVKTYLLRRNAVLFMRRHANVRQWVQFSILVGCSLAASLFTDGLTGRWAHYAARWRGYHDGWRARAVAPDTLFRK